MGKVRETRDGDRDGGMRVCVCARVREFASYMQVCRYVYVWVCVCVCVCAEHLKRCKACILLFKYAQGNTEFELGPCRTKLAVKWDIQLGQLDVPAMRSFSVC